MIARRALLAAGALGVALPARAAGGTLYLTLDTGWGREAERIAAILRARAVPATLFVAHEPTHRGDRSLDDGWGPFWRDRAAEGHAFASHTWRHWYFRADLAPGRVRYASRGGEGEAVLDAAAFREELARPVERLRALAPAARVLPLWRAPGGRTTPGALALARAMGLRHQGWSPAGFLGDELDAAAHPNAVLLARALGSLRDGDVLMLHWGVRRRAEPFALVLDPLLAGLEDRGFRFAALPATGIGAT